MTSLSRAAVVVALCAGSLACKRELKFRTVELPGFSLELPASAARGELLASQRYASGQVIYGGSRPYLHVAGVTWRPGTAMTDEELNTAVAAMAKVLSEKGPPMRVAVPTHVIRLADQPARQVVMAGGDNRMAMIDTACGARAVTMFAMAADPEPMLARMTSSYRCQPDPAEDAKLTPDRSPVGIDGLDDWKRIPDDESFMITNGTIVLSASANTSAKAVHEVGIDKMMTLMIPPSVGTWTNESVETIDRYGRSRQVAHGWLSEAAGRSRMVATAWNCGAGAGIFAWVAIDEADLNARTLTDAVDALARTRCLAMGEAPRDFPPIETAAETAPAP